MRRNKKFSLNMFDFYEISKWRDQTDCGSIRIGGVSLEVLSHIDGT